MCIECGWRYSLGDYSRKHSNAFIALEDGASGRCLPADKRLSHDQIKSGMEAPTLSAEEAEAHENAVIPHDLAAISVGLIDGEVYTDLDYILDSNADVDMNVVMTADGKFVEVQGTGEEFTYEEELDALLNAATAGGFSMRSS